MSRRARQLRDAERLEPLHDQVVVVGAPAPAGPLTEGEQVRTEVSAFDEQGVRDELAAAGLALQHERTGGVCRPVPAVAA